MGGVMGTEALKKRMKEFCEGNEDLYQEAEAIFNYGEKNHDSPNLDKRIKKMLDDAYDVDEESEVDPTEVDADNGNGNGGNDDSEQAGE